MSPSSPTEREPGRKPGGGLGNARVVLICVTVFVAMTGAAYAAVPLYRAFCQATGFAGTVSRAKSAPTTILAQTIGVRFDANVRGLPWTFTPDQQEQSIHIGQSGLAFFTVTNNSDKPETGRAAYNVSPDLAGAYFHKIRCFCFNDQTIPAHATIHFPVVYFLDPKFAADPDTQGYKDLTLSYTFYPVAKPG
ncbi:MAG TPA: cytochrome c oxidase assembly protein [Caulobacteraceae bacterium]|jgi:cytochrome c oxidase assembly protein subunit 11|nr:cytochrome c oxidase assembly protein [Caulobacteraceae bacterium]